MDDRNNDLPLVVAEILIELHGLNERMAGVEKAVASVEKAMTRMAEVMLLQQQETNKRFEMLMEADRLNTTLLINAFRDEAATTRQRLDQHDARITRLENK